MKTIATIFRYKAWRMENIKTFLILVFALSLFLSLGAPAVQAFKEKRGDTGEFTVIKGHIEEIRSTGSIRIRGGRYYDTAGVPVKDQDGNDARGRLTVGSLIEIRIKDNIVKAVTFIHGAMRE